MWRLGLSQRIARISHWAMIQRYGVPIGGLLSKAIVSLILGVQEAKYDKEFPGGAAERRKVFASRRFVDDALFTSCVLCEGCLHSVRGRVYEEQFSLAEGGKAAKWLDIRVLWNERAELVISDHEDCLRN